QIKSAAAANSGEVQSAVTSLMGQVDAFLLLQDNTVASALPAVLKTAEKKKTPVFAMFLDGVKAGALAGVAPDEYKIGKQTGEIVVSILHGEKAGNIPVADPVDIQTAINLDAAKKLNLKLDSNFIKSFNLVYP